MSVSSLFTSALHVVVNDVTLHEREFPLSPWQRADSVGEGDGETRTPVCQKHASGSYWEIITHTIMSQ
ncbi:hypothetical protein GBAR_LOCUS14564 [Geodia barretti]|uniref:Uncharacterized protein n=1 Tax=Geodia barretti TaxID=519541 RepID=A0AA35S8K8_GEOBA|nr:hypothetical protein GBAR_LOCUS14564 [Geodia barretti]